MQRNIELSEKQGGLQQYTLLALHKAADQCALNLVSHQLSTHFAAVFPDSVSSLCLSGCHLGVKQSHEDRES